MLPCVGGGREGEWKEEGGLGQRRKRRLIEEERFRHMPIYRQANEHPDQLINRLADGYRQARKQKDKSFTDGQADIHSVTY